MSSVTVQQRVQAACVFLKTLYNPTLQLVKERVDSTIYYIASDNLLAQRALSTCDPTVSRNIQHAINACCDNGTDQMQESHLGINIPLPIHNAHNRNSGHKQQLHHPMGTAQWQRNSPRLRLCRRSSLHALQYKRDNNQTGLQHELSEGKGSFVAGL